ncbi:GntR family transcriptional regulator [Niallia sp. 03133]|uniref:GntR family transcriptional regulator n=1 Tax=Niallia sp. 03133 TaxID=3458060 RepID=UPI00404465DA
MFRPLYNILYNINNYYIVGGIIINKKYLSLKDHVYDYIANEIQNGTLLPNHKINELELSKKLEVSRTPVREALIQLASENLLEYLPRRGFMVKELDTEKKLDVFKVVSVLDALAATSALDQITEDDIEKMEEYVKIIDLSILEKNYADYQKYQKKFHNVYIGKCNNSTLTSILETLQNSFVRQVYLSNDTDKLFSASEQMNLDHREIIKCFQSKEKERLEQLIRNHWEIKHPDMI